MELHPVRVEPRNEVAPADFDHFFRQHFPGVARAAALVAKDLGAGQDASQEAFARLYQRWDSFASADHARNFAYRVAINRARSHLRRVLRLSHFGLRQPDEPIARDPGPAVVEWMALTDALGALSPRQRSCVALVDYAGMDAAAAARTLGIGAGTVRVHLMRGRRALRERLDIPPEEDER